MAVLKLALLALLFRSHAGPYHVADAARMPGRSVTAAGGDDGTEEAKMRRLVSDLRERLGLHASALLDHDPSAVLYVPLTGNEKNAIRGQDRSANADPLVVGVTRPMASLVGKAKAGGVGVRGEKGWGAGRGGANGGFAMGVYRETDDGGFTWSLRVSSPGSYGLRLHLRDVDLPEGVEAYWMSSDQVDGPYKGQGTPDEGDVWTRTVFSDEALLVVTHSPGEGGHSLPEAARKGLSLAVAEVAVFDPFPSSGTGDRQLGCTFWENCIKDYMCCKEGTTGNECNGSFLTPDNSGAQDTNFRDTHLTNLSNSHAKIIWPRGPWLSACSAGLINNEGNKFLLLTANHCISRSNGGLETFFGDRNDACDNSCNSWKDGLGPADTVGMTVLATGRGSDFTLFETNPPTNGKTYYRLGWNSDPVGTGTKMFRVSHPDVGPQAYSESTSRSGQWCGGDYIYGRSTVGETMGGSSGSPTVNSNNEVVGQLYGVCGSNLDNSCDNDSNAIMDGAFSATFPSVECFLTPSSPNCGSTSDPCDGVTCDSGFICVDGSCVEESCTTCSGETQPCCLPRECKGNRANQKCRG